jgi:CRISPR-associated protein Cas6
MKVDVAFAVSGDKAPVDHGYALYGSISRILPQLHPPHGALQETELGQDLWRSVGIHPMNGRICGNRLLKIDAGTQVRIRIDREQVEQVMPLAGRVLELDGWTIRIGKPKIEPLVPSVFLRSRLVVIKGFMEPAPFLEAVARQLQQLRISGQPGIPYRKSNGAATGSPLLRRTLQIRDKVVVGYALEVSALTAEEAVALQEHGLGGRRRFGCGIFVPAA